MKVFEKLDPNTMLGLFSIIGNSVDICAKLDEIGDKETAIKLSKVYTFYIDSITEDAVEPKLGVLSVFNGGETLSFYVVRARIGMATKAVAKEIAREVKAGTLVQVKSEHGRTIGYRLAD